MGLQAEFDLRIARRDFASAIESRVVPLKRRGRYVQRSQDAHSHLGEQVDPYGVERFSSSRDRRRIRRTPSGPEARRRAKKSFFELADRLAESSDAAEQKRLKEELARL